MTINLSSPESAIAYLRSLPVELQISLPGAGESTTEGDAVHAITGENANEWAWNNGRKWDWKAGDLADYLSQYISHE